MKRNLKEQVLALRQEGKTLVQIKQQLTCSLSTIAYHLYHRTKDSTRKRVYARRKTVPRSDGNVLYRKYAQFFRLGHYRDKIVDRRMFTFNELLASLPVVPTCYLTGRRLNLNNPKDFSFDHKLPVSRGGQNSITNLGLASAEANAAKNSLLLNEFLVLCIRVLKHHGYGISKIK